MATTEPASTSATLRSSKRVVTKARLVAAGIALGGMIVGSLVGIAVQVGVENTGLLGPTVDALIDDQQANFADIGTQLEELRSLSSDPEVSQRLTELGRLLERQDELQSRANAELAFLGQQVATLREESLADRGYAGGADFWLKKGESVSVGSADNVFGVVRIWQAAADVNLNGRKSRLSVGDTVEFSANGSDCRIFYKQGNPRQDGRVGFDVTCA